MINECWIDTGLLTESGVRIGPFWFIVPIHTFWFLPNHSYSKLYALFPIEYSRKCSTDVLHKKCRVSSQHKILAVVV